MSQRIKMTDRKEIIYTTENQLITLKCKALPDGRRPVYLLGVVEMEKREESRSRVEKVEGWILIISGNPLIPHGVGGFYPSQISMDKLPVTCEQKKAMLDSSIIPDGYVYLYAGNFYVKKCTISEHSQEQNLNILRILSDYLNEYIVQVDLKRVVPFREQQVFRVIMPMEMKMIGSHSKSDVHHDSSSKEGKPEDGVKFKFKSTCHRVLVGLECPANHSEYRVEIYFLQTFVCKPNVVDPFGRRRITRLLEHDKVFVPASSVDDGEGSLEHCRSHLKSEEMDKITVTVKELQVPSYRGPRERQLLDEFHVARVDYWTIARLIKIKTDEWNGMTMAMLMGRGVENHDFIKGNITTGPSSSVKNSLERNLRSASLPVEGPSPSSQCPQRTAPGRLVIMELELIPSQRNEMSF